MTNHSQLAGQVVIHYAWPTPGQSIFKSWCISEGKKNELQFHKLSDESCAFKKEPVNEATDQVVLQGRNFASPPRGFWDKRLVERGMYGNL